MFGDFPAKIAVYKHCIHRMFGDFPAKIAIHKHCIHRMFGDFPAKIAVYKHRIHCMVLANPGVEVWGLQPTRKGW